MDVGVTTFSASLLHATVGVAVPVDTTSMPETEATLTAAPPVRLSTSNALVKESVEVNTTQFPCSGTPLLLSAKAAFTTMKYVPADSAGPLVPEAVLKMKPWPVGPGMPAGPCGPAAPCGPVAPVGPAGPFWFQEIAVVPLGQRVLASCSSITWLPCTALVVQQP